MIDIPKAYEPRHFESKWYQKWLENDCFKADVHSEKPPFSIVIPPPNVTGVLHMGHVLNNTIQDILARRARMDGFEVLWLPGTDHAGIATQVVVEKRLKKEEGIDRHKLGRERFVEKVWQWKEKHGGIIVEQLQKLGCSCDWSRMRFTMDADYSQKVAQTFVDLFHKGLIYRGRRMVNWCPLSHTALSDEEVIMKEQHGLLYFFQVEIVEMPGEFLSIATTRPETIPGDSGIAIHPKHPRFSKYIGKHARRPLPRELPEMQKHIPIVADAQVDLDFGTGVLKITPAHDKADFEIGERHSLPIIEVIDETGKMNSKSGKDLCGLDRFEARKVAVRILDEMGLLQKSAPYSNKVGFSERADVPIEPRLSEQWFMKYPSAEQARAVVESGKLKFHPERWKKVYEHWMTHLQDWCISRQLWWGHRIPVWRKGGEIKCQANSPGADWQQDPDVLDTWCSSWLWPFATMDEETLMKFYPTSVLVTAPEILFFWVARMIMAGLEYQQKIPFKDVVLHGIVRDRQGRKMAKSLGNSPDPLVLIARYGADALRFGIMRSTPRGQDTLFDEQNVKLGRNFCNKLWNACRFRQMQGEISKVELNKTHLTAEDQWILLKLASAMDQTEIAFESYKLNEATQTLYRFFWSEYCDWYVEFSKAILQSNDAHQKAITLAVMDFVLDQSLRLLHPFLPFITEELWQGMGFSKNANHHEQSIMNAPSPKSGRDFVERWGLDFRVLDFVKEKHELVKEGRNLRAEAGIPSNKKVRFIFKPFPKASPQITLSPVDYKGLEILLGAAPLDVDADFSPPKGTPNLHSMLGELYLPLEGLRDFQSEIDRWIREVEKLDKEMQKANAKLDNPSFIAKAPAVIVEKHRKRLNALREEKAHAQRNLAVTKSALE